MDIITSALIDYMNTHKEKDNIFFFHAKKLINQFTFDNVKFSPETEKEKKALINIKPGKKGYLFHMYRLVYYASRDVAALDKVNVECWSFTGSKFMLYGEPADLRYYYLQKMYISISRFASEKCKIDPFLLET